MGTKNTSLLDLCNLFNIIMTFLYINIKQNWPVLCVLCKSACYNFLMVYSPQSRPSRNKKKDNESHNTLSKSLVFAIIPLAVLVGLGIGYLFWGRVPDTTQMAASDETQEEAVRYDVSVDDDPYLGPKDAPVTIIMFSDYQCVYCQKWYAETLKLLLNNYPDKIRFVYRDFPLSSIHPSATLAAEGANCAGDQDKYWEFFDALFTNNESLGEQAIQNIATFLELDMDTFNQCLSSHKYQGEVEADFTYAANLGVQSTPTFFVNGLAVVGAQPYTVFSSLVDRELDN
jgi:protein-disulfide isomerase